MTSELIIDVQPKEISIALLEDKSLVEYQSESRSASFSVGNIYVAKVKKLMPGLNACFVDVGYERDAFLHYLDLGTQYSSYEKYLKQVQSDRKKLFPITKATRLPDLKKEGSVQNVLKVGQEVLVQVVKEPISTKGPRLTCDLSFAGRYMVLMPFQEKVSVSSKIKKGEERTRLKQLVQSIKPKNFGVIVRTSAEGKRVAELDSEMKILLKRWEDAITTVQKTTERPKIAFEETSRAVALIRDLFNTTYDGIHVNDETVFGQVKDYVGRDVVTGERIMAASSLLKFNGQETIQGHCPHLRQLQRDEAGEVGLWQDCQLQAWCLSHHRAHRGDARGGRKQR